MRLEQILYVVAIAEQKSISRAAKEMFVTQPAISNALKDLESEIGFEIFERTKTGVILTNKGEEFYSIAKSIQSDLERITRLSGKKQHTTELSIAATPMVWGIDFIDMMDTVRMAFPEIKLSAYEFRPRQLIDYLKRDAIDIALCGYAQAIAPQLCETIDKLGYEREEIARWPLAVFLPGSSPLAQEALSMERLKNIPRIIFKDTEPNAAPLDMKQPQTAAYSFLDRGSIKEAVAHNKGYAILPVSMAMEDIYVESGKIKVATLEKTHYINLSLVHHRTSILTEEEVAILSIIRDQMRKQDAKLKKQFRFAPHTQLEDGFALHY